jgi:hypothetical protein
VVYRGGPVGLADVLGPCAPGHIYANSMAVPLVPEVTAWFDEHVCRPGRQSVGSCSWWINVLASEGWEPGWPPDAANLGISPFESNSKELTSGDNCNKAAIPQVVAPVNYVAGALSPFYIERAYRVGSTTGQCAWCIYFGPFTSNGAATPKDAVAHGGAISAAFDMFTAQVAALAGYPQCVHAALNLRTRRPAFPIPGTFKLLGSILVSGLGALTSKFYTSLLVFVACSSRKLLARAYAAIASVYEQSSATATEMC